MESSVFIPKSVVLELTYRCNHKCLFCSCPWETTEDGYVVYDKAEELELEDWKKAIDILHDLGVENISISGGEALLKDCLLDILEYIREKNVFNVGSSIVLISNGLLMNEDYLKAFKKYNVHLSMSLPGLDTFEEHTGVDNAAGVLYWFQEAKKMGIETTVNVTVTKLNYHELYETIANGLIAGADTLLLNRFLIGGRGITNSEKLSLNREELNGMLETAEKILELSKRIGSVGTEYPLCIIKDREKYKQLRIGSLCSAAKDFFVIDPSGRVRACNHSPIKVGHIFDKEIISNKDYWQTFTSRAYIPNSCIMCEDVNYCDCGCRETASIVCKDLRAKDPCLD